MDVELSEGFNKTIADILEICVAGNTDSCQVEVEVKEDVKILNDMKFEIKNKGEKVFKHDKTN